MSKVTLEVFFSKTCPNCPPQKEAAKNFSDRDDVKVKLTDVMVEKKRAQNHGVSAVPTTVIDGPGIEQKTGFRGVTPQEKLETAVEVAKGEKEVEALENPGILDLLKNILS
jgi:predicted DsbA family dithiol-disulfide isomerase